MKKNKVIAALILSLTLALAAGCGTPKEDTAEAMTPSVTEAPAEEIPAATEAAGSYTKEEVTAYLYTKDRTENITVLKHPDLPGTAWISVMDFLKHDYNDQVCFEIEHTGDVYTITKKNNGITMEGVNTAMVLDAKNDTVAFDEQEMFVIGEDAYKEPGSTVDNPYVQELAPEYAKGSAVNSTIYDLAKYGFDVVGEGEDVYLPVAVITDIFGFNYNSAEYVDGDIYFVHAGNETGPDPNDPYVNKTSIYNNTVREKNEIEFAYNELCFALDEIYGYPASNPFSEQMKAQGFDKTVEQDEDLSHIKNEYLMSKDLVDYYNGLGYLTGMIYDGGHTGLVMLAGVFSTPAYQETELVKQYSDQTREVKFPEDAAKYNATMMAESVWKQALMEARGAAYTGNQNIVKETELTTYVETDDKGFFAFDKFNYAVLPELKEALDHAAGNGVKEFWFDLSCNGGGDERVAMYLMALVAGDGTLSYKNAKTGNHIIQKTEIDRNLDGVFDEKDDEMTYDFEYKIVTSQATFSSANLFACLAEKAGIPIYGERSGGGTCFVYTLNHTDSMAYILSGANIFSSPDDWNDLEAGAPVSEEWVKVNEDGSKDYSGFYDFITNA